MTGAAVGTTTMERNQESLRTSVEQGIRESILNGTLAPGAPLVQSVIADRFGVSQTPVRFALRSLAQEGLALQRPGGRTYVQALTRDDLEEIYALRAALEGLAARIGAPRLSTEGLLRMRELVESVHALAQVADDELCLQRQRGVGGVCYRASGRARLVSKVGELVRRAERYSRLLRCRCAGRPGWARLDDLVGACEQGDGDFAEQCVTRYLHAEFERTEAELRRRRALPIPDVLLADASTGL